MIAVQEFTEGLKTSKQQPESVATIIKREVAMEESHMKVIGFRILVYFSSTIPLYTTYKRAQYRPFITLYFWSIGMEIML